jgi:hypothetical protein
MGDYVKKSMSPGVNRDRMTPARSLLCHHPGHSVMSGN